MGNGWGVLALDRVSNYGWATGGRGSGDGATPGQSCRPAIIPWGPAVTLRSVLAPDGDHFTARHLSRIRLTVGRMIQVHKRYSHIHAGTRKHTHARTHARMQPRTRARARARAHTHTHTQHTHTTHTHNTHTQHIHTHARAH